MTAVKQGYLDIVQYLAEKGANINQRACRINLDDEEGTTALSIALDNNFTEIADYLRSKGATE